MSYFYPASNVTLRRKPRIPWPIIITVVVASVSIWIILRVRDQEVARREQRMVEIFAPNKVRPKSAAPLEPRTPTQPTAESLPERVRVPFREYVANAPTVPDEVSRAFELASGALRRAMQFGTEDDMRALVRHPELTPPRYRVWSAARPVIPAVPLQIGPKFGTTERLLVTSVRMADGSARHVVMERGATDYQLDWESFAGWGECFFSDVPDLPHNKPVLLRIAVQPTSAKPPFPHLAGMAMQISHPEDKLTLTAFASNAVLGKSKAGITMRDQARGPFTVRIVVDAECVKHGWVRIQEVICSGWVADL